MKRQGTADPAAGVLHAVPRTTGVRPKGGNGTGEFFAIDRRTWARVCTLGMNAACAYLVLACFSGRDNRTTAASAEAVERYVGISWQKAKAAIATLIGGGVVGRLREKPLPRYDLLPAADIPGLITLPEEPRHKAKQSPEQYEAERETWQAQVASAKTPDWIWLPNTLVRGAEAETPPVARVRETQDVMTLRLLVDLYHEQDLREDGGVSRALIWQEYKRVKVWECGEFVVWGFESKCGLVRWKSATECHRRKEPTAQEKKAGVTVATDYFAREQQLVDLGLLEWVPYLFESDSAEAECLHPLGRGGTDSLEDRAGRAAHLAGQALLTCGQSEVVANKGLWLVPVKRHMAKVTMVGIARLRYRPHTKKTAAWWADLNETVESAIKQFDELVDRQENRLRVAG